MTPAQHSATQWIDQVRGQIITPLEIFCDFPFSGPKCRIECCVGCPFCTAQQFMFEAASERQPSLVTVTSHVSVFCHVSVACHAGMPMSCGCAMSCEYAMSFEYAM